MKFALFHFKVAIWYKVLKAILFYSLFFPVFHPTHSYPNADVFINHVRYITRPSLLPSLFLQFAASISISLTCNIQKHKHTHTTIFNCMKTTVWLFNYLHERMQLCFVLVLVWGLSLCLWVRASCILVSSSNASSSMYYTWMTFHGKGEETYVFNFSFTWK